MPYILDFIDDVSLRQAEQHIWNECSRLITNAIIYYKTALLSKVYEQKRAAGEEEAIKVLRGVSPSHGDMSI